MNIVTPRACKVANDGYLQFLHKIKKQIERVQKSELNKLSMKHKKLKILKDKWVSISEKNN